MTEEFKYFKCDVCNKQTPDYEAYERKGIVYCGECFAKKKI